MIQHLSFRVPWHDDGWKGTICKDPAHNMSCLRLRNILENRDDQYEAENSGDLMCNHIAHISCIEEGGAFMSDKPLIVKAIHPYKETNPDTHGHFLETEIEFPPYSLSGRPFSWLLSENIKKRYKYYGVEYDYDKEPVLAFEIKGQYLIISMAALKRKNQCV